MFSNSNCKLSIHMVVIYFGTHASVTHSKIKMKGNLTIFDFMQLEAKANTVCLILYYLYKFNYIILINAIL